MIYNRKANANPTAGNVSVGIDAARRGQIVEGFRITTSAKHALEYVHGNTDAKDNIDYIKAIIKGKKYKGWDMIGTDQTEISPATGPEEKKLLNKEFSASTVGAANGIK